MSFGRFKRFFRRLFDRSGNVSFDLGGGMGGVLNPASALKASLDIEPGAVSIMGLMNDHDHAVQLLIDKDVLEDEYIGCHPCVCTSSLKMRTEDVIRTFLPATGHEYMTVRLTGEV